MEMEAFFEKPYWVIDFLPAQVPQGGAGQFFAVERFYLQKRQQDDLRRRFARILLQLNCYVSIRVCGAEAEKWESDPAPERLVARILAQKEDLRILLPYENALIALEREDTCMTVYGPREKLLGLLERLAAGAGLYLWRPPQKEEADP